MSSAISKIAKNSLIMMLCEIVNKALTLILTIAIARYLGDSGFGSYSFVIAMTMLFQVFADFGLDGLTIREIAKKPEKTDLYLKNILFLKLCLGLISLITLGIIINFMQKPISVIYSVYVAGLSILFYSLANTFSSTFNAHDRLDLKAFLLSSSKVVVLSLSIIAILLKEKMIVFFVILLIAEIIRTLMGWGIYRKKFSKLKAKVSPELCKSLFITSAPFALIAIISLIYFKIDIVMLSLMKNDQVVGWYSAAYTLLAALMFIASAYNLAIFPSLSRYADSSKKLLRFGWEKSVKYLFMVSMPIAVGVTILSGRFISLFYSSSFSRSSVALVVLIWSLPWIFVNSINMRVLYATDNQKKATVVAFISMILNILLNLVLIPKYSYLGASLATVIVEIINVSVNFWLVFKLLELKIKISEVLPKTISASLIMGTFIYFLRSMNLAFLVLFSMVVYFVSLTILNAFDKEDRRVISELTAFANFNREHK